MKVGLPFELKASFGADALELISPGQQGDQEDVLFVVHDSTGVATHLHSIAPYCAGFRCYAIKVTGTTPTDTLDDMAMHHANVIVDCIQHLPGASMTRVHLAGYSFGVKVAFQVGLILNKQGRHRVHSFMAIEGSPFVTQELVERCDTVFEPLVLRSTCSDQGRRRELKQAIHQGAPALSEWMARLNRQDMSPLLFQLLSAGRAGDETSRQSVFNSLAKMVTSLSSPHFYSNCVQKPDTLAHGLDCPVTLVRSNSQHRKQFEKETGWCFTSSADYDVGACTTCTSVDVHECDVSHYNMFSFENAPNLASLLQSSISLATATSPRTRPEADTASTAASSAVVGPHFAPHTQSSAHAA
eukprot:m.13182 g.13182  ORF g.13182 m.13182 type:complete len:356 (+) comp5910_c0_seq1:541-1608(+)